MVNKTHLKLIPPQLSQLSREDELKVNEAKLKAPDYIAPNIQML